MDEAKQISAEVFEGTWEEIADMASKFAGHRVRVQKLPDAVPSPLIRSGPPGRYAEYMQNILNNLPPATPAEMQQAEDELLEFKRNMNENRRREGAEILYLDV